MNHLNEARHERSADCPGDALGAEKVGSRKGGAEKVTSIISHARDDGE